MIGIGPAIPDVAEFNRRAAIALGAVLDAKGEGFLHDMRALIKRGGTPSPKQQQALFNALNRHRRDITDSAVAEYAAARARGHDA